MCIYPLKNSGVLKHNIQTFSPFWGILRLPRLYLSLSLSSSPTFVWASVVLQSGFVGDCCVA